MFTCSFTLPATNREGLQQTSSILKLKMNTSGQIWSFFHQVLHLYAPETPSLWGFSTLHPWTVFESSYLCCTPCWSDGINQLLLCWVCMLKQEICWVGKHSLCCFFKSQPDFFFNLLFEVHWLHLLSLWVLKIELRVNSLQAPLYWLCYALEHSTDSESTGAELSYIPGRSHSEFYWNKNWIGKLKSWPQVNNSRTN